MHIGILESERFSSEALAVLQTMGTVSCLDEIDVASFVTDKEVLFVRLQYRIDKTFLDYAPALRFICSPTTGLTHIDIGELHKRGITLISLKGEHAFLRTVRATPEFTFNLILSLLRNYITLYTAKRCGILE